MPSRNANGSRTIATPAPTPTDSPTANEPDEQAPLEVPSRGSGSGRVGLVSPVPRPHRVGPARLPHLVRPARPRPARSDPATLSCSSAGSTNCVGSDHRRCPAGCRSSPASTGPAGSTAHSSTPQPTRSVDLTSSGPSMNGPWTGSADLSGHPDGPALAPPGACAASANRQASSCRACTRTCRR